MKLVFERQALDDLQHWVKTDRKMAAKVLQLIEHVERDPYKGVGKPEQLKHNLAGLWSRRISQEHRLVYQIKNNELLIHSCRYHY